MLKAGALYHAIGISFIITLVISAFILGNRLRSGLNIEQLNKALLSDGITSGINLALSKDLTGAETFFMDEERKKIQVELSSSGWGVFKIIKCRSTIGKISQTKAVLCGWRPDPKNSPTLYLADLDKPLALCGRTEINGLAVLPKAGVKRAYIEGQSFVGSKLINGDKQISKSSIPAINKEVSGAISPLLSLRSQPIEIEGTKIARAFSDSTLILFQQDTLNLQDVELRGNIVIASGSGIFIDESCVLQDIIVVAPHVVIDDHFKGSVQVFATNEIKTGEYVELDYPSVLGVINSGQSELRTGVELGKKSTIRGVILGIQQKYNRKFPMKVSLGKESLLYGQLYSNRLAELKGTVIGHSWVNKFILRTPSSIYENHLLGIKMDGTVLSPDFVGCGLMGTKGKSEIIKWLQ